MVDNDPDYSAYIYPKTNSNVAVSLHVVFLDKEVSRRWIRMSEIKPFREMSFESLAPFHGRHQKDYTHKVKVAYDRAMAALKLPVEERLKLFGFAPRFHDSLYESSLSESEVHLFPGREPAKRKRLSKKSTKSGIKKSKEPPQEKNSSTEEEEEEVDVKFQ